jgi:hypothetical protein
VPRPGHPDQPRQGLPGGPSPEGSHFLQPVVARYATILKTGISSARPLENPGSCNRLPKSPAVFRRRSSGDKPRDKRSPTGILNDDSQMPINPLTDFPVSGY